MKSLEKVFRIIDLVEDNKEMKLQEIADELGLYKSTAHRLVAELCKNGFLRKNESTKSYQLGMKFVDLSSHIIDNMDIREVATRGIKRLNDVTGETIHLALLVDNQVIYVDKKESAHAIRMYSQIGKVAPIYCTGVGKAVLAFQPAETIEKLLDGVHFQRFTPNTIVTRKELVRELATIRRNGFDFDREEHELHVGCIAGPVRDNTASVVASVSVTAVLYQLKWERLVAYRDLLLSVCKEISTGLGYRESMGDGARAAPRRDRALALRDGRSPRSTSGKGKGRRSF